MGRVNVPTAILDARGAYIKHPDRKRHNEPQPVRPLGPPPKYLSTDLKKLWKEVAKRLAPGVAMESDRDSFEMLVRLTYDLRNDRPDRPFLGVQRSALITLWGRFAMTPSDRSKVVVEKPKESSLATFMRRRKDTQPPAAVELAN